MKLKITASAEALEDRCISESDAKLLAGKIVDGYDIGGGHYRVSGTTCSWVIRHFDAEPQSQLRLRLPPKKMTITFHDFDAQKPNDETEYYLVKLDYHSWTFVVAVWQHDIGRFIDQHGDVISVDRVKQWAIIYENQNQMQH